MRLSSILGCLPAQQFMHACIEAGMAAAQRSWHISKQRSHHSKLYKPISSLYVFLLPAKDAPATALIVAEIGGSSIVSSYSTSPCEQGSKSDERPNQPSVQPIPAHSSLLHLPPPPRQTNDIPHRPKSQHITNPLPPRKKHDKAIHTTAPAAGRWETPLQRFEVALINAS